MYLEANDAKMNVLTFFLELEVPKRNKIRTRSSHCGYDFETADSKSSFWFSNSQFQFDETHFIPQSELRIIIKTYLEHSYQNKVLIKNLISENSEKFNEMDTQIAVCNLTSIQK